MVEVYNKFLHAFLGSYTRKILIEALDLLWKLWPYIVLGIIITTVVKLYISKKKLTEVFTTRIHISILMAALFGVISPLGSYVVIPLSAALFAIGVPLPSLMAFLVSSPLIDPNLFILTAGAFGIEMAIMRTLASFFLGITAGYVTWFLIKKNQLKTVNVLKDPTKWDISGFQKSSGRGKWEEFLFEAFKMTKYIGKYFMLAILLSAMIKILVSPDFIIRYLGDNVFLSVLLTTGAAIPFYVCGGAAIPVVQQLAELGMSKGAVLAFFIAGPVTKLSNLLLMYSAFRAKVFSIYLTVGILGALMIGILYGFF